MPFALEALEATFQMLSEARGQDKFTLHLTHGRLPVDEKPNKLLDFFKRETQAGKKYQTVVREGGELGVAVQLLG